MHSVFRVHIGILVVMLGVVIAGSPVLSASAITVTADPSANSINTSIIGTSNGIGSAGYYLFDWNNTNVVTPAGEPNGAAFASNASYDGNISDSPGNYSNLAISGVDGSAEEQTGSIYGYYGGVSPEANLLTITLGSNTPSSFILSLLNDEAYYSNNDQTTTNVIPTDVSAGLQATATQDVAGNDDHNEATDASYDDFSSDFYSFLVTNASPGDTLAIYNTSYNEAYESFGGVAFEAVTPEPCSILFAGLGGLSLLFRRSRRQTV